MPRFLNLVTRFGRDERGAFAVIFGLIAVVLVALGGATVDYVSLQQSRSRAQIALDAAALALQPEIYNAATTKEQIRVKAEALMLDRLGDEWGVVASIEAAGITIDQANGSLYLKARMSMPTNFVSLVGVNSLNAEIRSEARRKKLELEVVMVLDNSGSMLQDNRIQRLKEAARCATNTLFYDDVNNDTECSPTGQAKLLENVKIGVVPFTMYVNVGSSNASQSWIDKLGASVTSNDNFDIDENENTPFVNGVNRLALFDDITNDSWRGCVEARPHISVGGTTTYLDTDDTLPVAGNTLFVPLFAPDVTDGVGSSYTSYTNDSPASCDRPSDPTVRCTYTEVKKNVRPTAAAQVGQ